MKKLLHFSLFLSICFLPQVGKAQLNRQWAYDYSTPDTAYMSVIGLYDAGNGNVIKATFISKFSPPDNSNRLMLQKISAAGTVIWEEIYQHPMYDEFYLYNGGIDQQGNTYFSGQLTITPQDPGWFVISFDSNGQERWRKELVENIYIAGGSQKCVTDLNGNTFVSGNIYDNGLSMGTIVKYDQLGNEQWVRYNSTNYNFGADMVIAANGDLITCDGQYELSRFASDGQLLWNTPDTADFIYATPKIAEAPDGSIYAVTFTNMGYSLKKLNGNGVFQWNYTQFAQNLVFGDYGMDMVTDADNFIYLSGINSTDSGSYQTAVFKFNPSGSEVWRQEFSTQTSEVTDLLILPTGNLVAAANHWYGGPYYPGVYVLDKQNGAVMDSDTLSLSGSQGILLNNQSGLFLAGTGDFYTLLAHYDNTLSLGENEDQTSVLIYPNPFSAEINIQTPFEEAQFECLELSGKVICRGELNKHVTISLPNLAPGIYLFKIKDKNGEVISRRIVKS